VLQKKEKIKEKKGKRSKENAVPKIPQYSHSHVSSSSISDLICQLATAISFLPFFLIFYIYVNHKLSYAFPFSEKMIIPSFHFHFYFIFLNTFFFLLLRKKRKKVSIVFFFSFLFFSFLGRNRFFHVNNS